MTRTLNIDNPAALAPAFFDALVIEGPNGEHGWDNQPPQEQEEFITDLTEALHTALADQEGQA